MKVPSAPLSKRRLIATVSSTCEAARRVGSDGLDRDDLADQRAQAADLVDEVERSARRPPGAATAPGRSSRRACRRPRCPSRPPAAPACPSARPRPPCAGSGCEDDEGRRGDARERARGRAQADAVGERVRDRFSTSAARRPRRRRARARRAARWASQDDAVVAILVVQACVSAEPNSGAGRPSAAPPSAAFVDSRRSTHSTRTADRLDLLDVTRRPTCRRRRPRLGPCSVNACASPPERKGALQRCPERRRARCVALALLQEAMGWPMGFEPTTTGITIQDSTVELRPPLKPCCCMRAVASRDRARPTGLEPVTAGLEGRCSIQLSYGREACR